MRELTIRGRCFLAAGFAAVVCGIQVGEHDFVRIGLLAAAVPGPAWLLVRRTSVQGAESRALADRYLKDITPSERGSYTACARNDLTDIRSDFSHGSC